MTDATDTTEIIDVETEPALRALVDRIRQDRKPRALKLEGRTVAIIGPKLDRQELMSDPRRAAILRLAGRWKGLVDRDEMLKIIYEGRGCEYPPDADE